jgi:hypothetical protein
MPRFPLVVLILALLASTSHATVVFDQSHNGSGTLHKSSWYPPDGLDGDTYCWDNFTLASSTAISEVHWRGAYELHPSGSGQSPVSRFDLSIYRSIAGNSQPDMGAGGLLAHYIVSGNGGETAAGTFGGVLMYDYAFTLPSPFQAAAGTTYWVEIVASQGAVAPSFAPDWGLAVGSGGNNSHFRRITGATFQTIANDLAFSLVASGSPTVNISASESPTGSGVITGAGAYPLGSTASLIATANAGWGFVNWTEGGTPVSSNANYHFTATVDRTLVANFDLSWNVLTASYPPYAGTVAGAGVYTNGSVVTLIATPAHGFVFSSWSDGATTATHTFTAGSDVTITAFFDSAPDAVTFDFDAAPLRASLPLDLTVNGLTGHFTGGYSIQPVGTLGISPAGFSGNYVYPNSVFQSDLGIGFSETLKDFSVLYAVDELACDVSARMRVTAYMNGVFVGTNTMVAPVPGTYPSATLAIAVPAGFNSVVVHWDAPGTLCQDYGPIFFADNVTVTRVTPPVGVGGAAPRATLRLDPPAPDPFRSATRITFALPAAADVRLTVFDLLGRRVRALVRESRSAGDHHIVWNGADDAGRDVRAGMYVLLLESGGMRLSRRVIVVN